MTIRVSMVEFSERLDEWVATAARGHDVVVFDGDRPVVRMSEAGSGGGTVADDPEIAARLRRRQAWLDSRPKAEIIGPPVTVDEILEWIREGRK